MSNGIRYGGLLMTALLACCGSSHAASSEITLTVRETAGVARRGGVVTAGIPFAKGAVTDLSKLSVAVEGKTEPAQFKLLSPWPDGSVRWALATFRADVPAGGKVVVALKPGRRNPAPDSPVVVSKRRDAVEVSTGPLRFTVGKSAGALFQSLEVGGRPVLTRAGRGIVLTSEDGQAVVAGPPSEVVVEEGGPVRAVVRVGGSFGGVHNGLLRYTARITVHAGGKALHVRMWLENDGAHGYDAKPEWLHFDGLAIELGLGLGDPVSMTCEGVTASGKMRVTQQCPEAQWSRFAFTVTGEGIEPTRGARTDGVVELRGPHGRMTAAVRHFWQNYDKAIELDGGVLRLWLWPTDSQWPRPQNLRGGGDQWLKNPAFVRPGLNALPGGVHKSHQWVLDFSDRSPKEVAAELSAPLGAVNPDYAASTEAANALFAPAITESGHEELDWKFRFWRNLSQNLVDPKAKRGLQFARTEGCEQGAVWFGWMDFGDVCSPNGGWYSGAVTPRNLHHNWTWAVLLQYLRTGDPAFLELGTEMARHQMEIDLNWSDRDHEKYRALFRSDNPCSELHAPMRGLGPALPNYEQNWLSGLVLYYLLTGDVKARDAALRNGAALRGRVIEWLRGHPSDDVQLARSLLMLENSLSLHAMTGDSTYLNDIDVLLTGHLLRRFKDCGPFLYERRMEVRGQEYHRLGEQFCDGIRALCEYHHRTRDARVGKILAEACARPFPDTFYAAPLYFSDLYGYVGRIMADEKLLEKGMDCFADSFPESVRPPAFYPGRKDWSQWVASLLCTGHVLQHAVWKGRLAKPAPWAAEAGLVLGWPNSEAVGGPLEPKRSADGSLSLDVKTFGLKDCEVRELEGALGGKAVALRQFTSAATANVRLPPGFYELVIHAWAKDDESDAFNVIVNGKQFRIYPNEMRRLVPCGSIRFVVAGNGTVNICIAASEENGMLVDKAVIRPRAE